MQPIVKENGDIKSGGHCEKPDATLIVTLPSAEATAVQRVADLLGNDFTGMLLDVLNKQLDFWEWANDRAEVVSDGLEAEARK